MVYYYPSITATPTYTKKILLLECKRERESESERASWERIVRFDDESD